MNDRSLPFQTRGIVLLIDPDRVTAAAAAEAVRLAVASGFVGAWVGGTFIHRAGSVDIVRATVEAARSSGLPVFAILGLSSAESVMTHGLSGVLLPLVGTLASAGELIRQAYRATPVLAALGVPVIPIAYLAVDGGRITSSVHGLQGVPLPRDKPEIISTLALCAEYTGAQAVYLDAGSGASEAIPPNVIERTRRTIGVPLIIGGGIRRPEQAAAAFAAGADVVVLGSVFETTTPRDQFEAFGAAVRRQA